MEIKKLLTIVILMIWISLSLVVYAQQSIPGLVNEVNNEVVNALQRCGVVKGVFVTSKFITYTNNSITINIGFSNNYELIMTLNLSANNIPMNAINITMETSTNTICYSSKISIPQVSGYNYYMIKTNYSLIIISYVSTQTPIVTGTIKSIMIYGITPITIMAIPISYGYITCNTGLLRPTYIISVLNQPIIYLSQGNLNTKGSVLCTYHQGYYQYFLIMALITGLSIAIIYEAVMLFIVMRRETIS